MFRSWKPEPTPQRDPVSTSPWSSVCDPEPKPESKPDPKPDSKPDPKPDPKPEPKPEPKSVPKPEPKPVPNPELKPEPKPGPKPERESESGSTPSPDSLLPGPWPENWEPHPDMPGVSWIYRTWPDGKKTPFRLGTTPRRP